jgi:hypothetical protein
MMGTDIHVTAQRKTSDGKWEDLNLEIWDFRDYSVFAFLAGVRNYSGIVPLSLPRGCPEDGTCYIDDENDPYLYHSVSWFSMGELLEIKQDKLIEDRRYTKKVGNVYDGGATCAIGEGETKTLLTFLGKTFFDDIRRASDAGADRVIFAFDN